MALTMFHNLLGDLVREFCCGCMQPLGVGNSLVERSVAETARKAGPASSTERSEPDELVETVLRAFESVLRAF